MLSLRSSQPWMSLPGNEDTVGSNAYSEFMRGNHRVREIVQAAEEILMSAVVVGEQLFGFRQGPATYAAQ